MAVELTTSYLQDAVSVLQTYKRLAERALEQVGDEGLFEALDEESNSIAIVIKHMVGNMRSRWTDFLTTDGEKPWRGRDYEFVQPPANREALLQLWNEGWELVFRTLEPLSEEDLKRTITIRGEAHSVMQAINRAIAHYASHVGQIVVLAKHFAGNEWTALSIPRNRSAEFTARR